MSLAAFLGFLAGSMINPFVWAPVLGLKFALKQYAWYLQLAACLAAILLIALAFEATPKAIGFGLLSAVLWLAIFSGAFRLFGSNA